uniref:Uncharacterized protein n=1 Tax=Panagrolaimus sp. ES5 TaxID=591445 RepID=A0AC34EZA6_9BILA
MREMVQLYFDQATIAKREAALNAERNLNLQSRLSTSEIAYARLLDILETLEPKLIQLLQKAAENEMIRIEATQEFKDAHDRLEYETKTLSKELTQIQKDANEYAANCRKLQHEVAEKNSELAKLKSRADISEKELESLKFKVSDALKTARDTQTMFNKAQHQVDRLKDEVESEKKKSQQREEHHQRECEKLVHERDMAMDRQKKVFEKEISHCRAEYDKSIQQHKRSAQEAITKSAKEASDAIESQKKYYKLYTDLQANLEVYKKQLEQKTFAKLLNGYRNFANEFNEEQVRGIPAQLRSVPAPTSTNKFSEKCLDILQSSSSASTSPEHGNPQRNENIPPIRPQRTAMNQQQQSRGGIRQTARSYSVTGRFPAKR